MSRIRRRQPANAAMSAPAMNGDSVAAATQPLPTLFDFNRRVGSRDQNLDFPDEAQDPRPKVNRQRRTAHYDRHESGWMAA